jgi:hypothetical protein
MLILRSKKKEEMKMTRARTEGVRLYSLILSYTTFKNVMCYAQTLLQCIYTLWTRKSLGCYSLILSYTSFKNKFDN